jgi:hypothetical protein
MKFTGVVLNLDGQPDSSGDIFSSDIDLKLKKHVKIVYEFQRPEKIIGHGTIKREGDQLTYDIDVDTTSVPEAILKCLTPAIGGHIIARDGKKITKAHITEIGLSISGNDDPRIKKLGEE